MYIPLICKNDNLLTTLCDSVSFTNVPKTLGYITDKLKGWGDLHLEHAWKVC